MLVQTVDEKCIVITDDNLITDNEGKMNKNISKIELNNCSIRDKIINIEKALKEDEAYELVCKIGLIIRRNISNHKYCILEIKKVDIEKQLSNLSKLLNSY